MNWFIIFSIILILAVIMAPLIWLLIKAAKNNEFQGTSVERIAVIKELEMIENMYDKQSKS